MSVEIILKEDVDKLGRRGDVVKVADGYARNYLLPHKLAIAASAANLRNVEQMRAASRRREARDHDSAQALATQLAARTLVFARRAGEQETLFGSVTSMDIAAELADQGFEIDRRKIDLPEPLKILGQFKVPLRLYRDVTVELSVEVQRAVAEE